MLEEQTSRALPEHGWAFLPDSKEVETGGYYVKTQTLKNKHGIIHAFLGPVLGQLQINRNNYK